MSTRTVYACDLCGEECGKEALRTMFSQQVISTLSGQVDVGTCCEDKPIKLVLDLLAADQKLRFP